MNVHQNGTSGESFRPCTVSSEAQCGVVECWQIGKLTPDGVKRESRLLI